MTVSETISIRPVESTDAPRVQALASHPEILRYTELPNPYIEGSAALWIQNAIIHRAKAVAYDCVIEQPREGIIGVCGFIDIEHTEHAAEIGFWLGYEYWGKGYMTQACYQLIAKGIELFQLRYITARVYLDNYVSRYLLEKIGFEQTALEEKIVSQGERPRSLIHYQLSLE